MGLALTLTLALAPALALTLSLTPTLTLTLTLTLILTLSQAWLELALGHARDERVGGHLSHVQLEPRAVPVLVVDPVPSDLRAKGGTSLREAAVTSKPLKACRAQQPVTGT